MADALKTPDDKRKACADLAATMRRWIIEQSLDSHVGHIGSALSIVDIVSVLWEGTMQNPGTELPDRDRFILSKGHAALALYCALRWKKILSEDVFNTYCKNGSMLGVHPEWELKGVDLSTGSLGQGLSVACGLAYGLRQKKSPARIYVLLSDAECNEGQVWEAAMFGAHHRLANLTAIVDLNGLQALGCTRDILNIADIGGLWKALGWRVIEADGHDQDALLAALNGSDDVAEPTVILAKTMLGKGVSFMENRLEWHYMNISSELAKRALAELNSSSTSALQTGGDKE